jgi:ABC-type multidrug transport system fused ATPase/permease subunit
MENISYGVEGEVSQEQLKKAIEMANASEFIFNKNLFPLEMDTIVG